MRSKVSQQVTSSKEVATFRLAVWQNYRKAGRHDLPWRKTGDPYRILVSEVMLQQTQVPRVLEKYREFLRAFPTVRALASAKLSDVLKVWSGLGYNRRGKYLHDSAKVIVVEYKGNFKMALTGPLPGVGPYTRSAIRTFAFNEPHTMIETNIRAAFIHHFFSNREPTSVYRGRFSVKVTDRELVPLIEKAAVGQDPREWHWALMDYGVHIKKLHQNPARKSAAYVRQSRFEGSLRQMRGAILRSLHAGTQPKGGASRLHASRLRLALAGLAKDGLIVKEKGKWRIA